MTMTMTMTDTSNTTVTDLEAQRDALKAHLQNVNEQIRTAKGTRSRTTRGHIRENSTTARITALLTEKGALPARDILVALESTGVKPTSVRTLLSALSAANKIVRSGKPGSYVYGLTA